MHACRYTFQTVRCQSIRYLRFSIIDYCTRVDGFKRGNLLTDVISIQKRWLSNKSATSPAQDYTLMRWSKTVWSKMFGKYLFATNVISSGVLMVVGDVIAQQYELRRTNLRVDGTLDYARMWRMFLAGAVQGPLHHWVYNWMDRIMPHRTFRSTVNKILIDQFFMSPICIVLFFYTICYLEHQTLECTHKEIVQKFPYIYLTDWIFWPAAQYFNFTYLDTKYRVGFVNVCTAIYNVFISYMKHDFGITLPLELINKDREEAKVADVAPVKSA